MLGLRFALLAFVLLTAMFLPSVAAHHGDPPVIWYCDPQCDPLTVGCPWQLVDSLVCAAGNVVARSKPFVQWVVDNDCHVWSFFC